MLTFKINTKSYLGRQQSKEFNKWEERRQIAIKTSDTVIQNEGNTIKPEEI